MGTPNSLEEIQFFSSKIADSKFQNILRIRHLIGCTSEVHSYSLAHQVSPLEKVRNNIMKGNFKSAQIELNSLNLTDKSELYLEKARLFALDGEFESAVKYLHRATSFNPNLVSQFTILQVAMLCYFELGDFETVKRLYSQSNHLAQMLPLGQVPLYSSILSQMASLRLGKLQDFTIWTFDTSLLNPLDWILCYSRFLIDRRRYLNQTFLEYSISSYLVSKRIGDELYTGLALLDIQNSKEAELDKELMEKLNQYADDYSRIKSILSDNTKEYESKIRIRKFKLPFNNPLQKISLSKLKYRLIIVKNFNKILDLKSGLLVDNKFTNDCLKELLILSRGTVSVSAYFKSVRQGQRYINDLHYGWVKNRLSNIRTKLGIDIYLKKGEITSERIWVIK